METFLLPSHWERKFKIVDEGNIGLSDKIIIQVKGSMAGETQNIGENKIHAD